MARPVARSRCETLLLGCAVLTILQIAAGARFLEPAHALPSSSAGLPLAESTWQPLAEASDVASTHAGQSSASPKVASGYVRLHRPRPDTDARMFYVFVESRNPTPETPLILWLTGGPGCSGELPLLVEQGPYELEGFNVSTGAGGDVLVRRRRYSWDRQFHLLYLDQPVGTGFSYSTDPHDKAHNERDVSRDVLDFLHQFYAARPGLANTSLFIGGESYAGHYIPPLASAVLRANARRDSSALRIPLRGVAIVNGYFDPGVQYSSMADYVYSNGLISTQLRDSINRWMPLCRGAARLCGLSRWGWACKAAAWACDALSFQRLIRALPHINWADIRMVCDPASRPLGTPCYYNFSAIHRYWNRPDVQVDGGQRRGAECRL